MKKCETHEKSPTDKLVESKYTADTKMSFWQCQKCGLALSNIVYERCDVSWMPSPSNKALPFPDEEENTHRPMAEEVFMELFRKSLAP